jgi:hypothetical protein
MTVAQLIQRLQQIENKDAPVRLENIFSALDLVDVRGVADMTDWPGGPYVWIHP